MSLDSLNLEVGCALKDEARKSGRGWAMKTFNGFAEQCRFHPAGHSPVTAFQDHFGSRIKAEWEVARQRGQLGGRFNGTGER